MQENRLPGERPYRHPAAGIWERTSPRFHRDRSRRDACPTLRPRPENNPVKGQARNLFIADRNYCITKYLAAPTADPGEFCGVARLLERNFRNMLEYRLPGASCRPAQPSARAWGRSSTPAFTPFCPKRSRGGRCSRRRPRFPRDPRRTTRCRVRGLRLRNPAFRSRHRTIWDRRSGLAQCRTSCRDSVGRAADRRRAALQ